MWYVEKLGPDWAHFFAIGRLILSQKTSYQRIDIVEHELYGKMLFLDGNLQLTTGDEWIYHEALIHQPMLAHKKPERVAVIGGGDGGAMREILKHGSVKKAYLIDLDPGVVEASKKHLAEVSAGALQDERVEIVYEEGRTFLERSGKFDVIVCDITDPFSGLSAKLFTKEFYQLVKDRLGDGGVFATQAEAAYFSHLYFKISFPTIIKTLRAIFDYVVPYTAFIPSYGNEWGFAMAANSKNPLGLGDGEITARMRSRKIRTRFYTPRLYNRLTILPLNIQKAIEEHGDVVKDQEADELIKLRERVASLEEKLLRDEILALGSKVGEIKD